MSAYVHSSHATKSSWGSTNFQGFKQALIFHTWILNPNIPSYTFPKRFLTLEPSHKVIILQNWSHKILAKFYVQDDINGN